MQRYVLIPYAWVNLVQYPFDRASNDSVSRSNHFLSSELQITSFLFAFPIRIDFSYSEPRASDLFMFSNLFVSSR